MADQNRFKVDVRRNELPPLLYIRPLTEPIGEHPPDGHIVRFAVTHPYVERCWLPIIGPSGTWCLRRFGAELAAHPKGTTIEIATLARDLGLSGRTDEWAPLRRTLQRLADFNLVCYRGCDTFEVRTTVPPVGQHGLARLSRESRDAHFAMVAEASNSMLAAALCYARRGLAVLPLRPNEKMPDGRLVPHGLTDATTNEARIRRWWAASPMANVGIRTGDEIDVIDLDSPAARLALEDLAPEPLRAGIVVRTSRGWHLWFASCGLPTRAGVLEGIDVRGVGGYIVAPPSRHPDGRTYAFLDEQTGELTPWLPETRLMPVPEWLIEELRPTPRAAPEHREPIRLRTTHYVSIAVESECLAVANAPEGTRNHRLNRAAFALGTLVGAELLNADSARMRLLDAALCAGLDEREAQRTIASGLTAGERRPRQRSDALGDTEHRAANKEGRPPDPSRRPDEAATAAVLARARGAFSSSAPRAVTPLPPNRELGR